jgi:hypothetical protein
MWSQMGSLLSISLLCAAALFPAAVKAQQMDYHARLQMEAKVARLADPSAKATLATDASAVMAGVGLAWDKAFVPDGPKASFVPDSGAVLELVDIRLILTQVAIQTGARDHVALVRAQADNDHDVILLRGGFARFSDLLALSEGTPAQDFIKMGPRGLVLTRPLAIWSDAGLTIEAGDHLILDRPSGSFVANLGWLNVSGGKLSGSAGQNSAETAFRPFVITAGQGSFTARDATFQALGFGDAAVFGGLSVANNGLVASRMASALVGSTLYDVTTIGLIGTTGAVVAGNWIASSSGTAVLISGSTDTTVASNRLSALSGTQAIRVTAGSAMVRIEGNLLSGEARTGILIDRESQNVIVAHNLVASIVTTGISVDTSTCVMLMNNLVAANGGSGINLRDTDAVEVADNAILFNSGSGVMVRDQADTAAVRVAGNVFIGNRDGLRGATPGNLALSENNMDGQITSMFAGDLSRLTADWLRSRKAAPSQSVQARSPAPCAIQGNG